MISHVRRFTFGALLALLALAAPLSAQRVLTPTEKVAACITNAADSYNNCIKQGGWLWDQLCVIKYEADALLCAFDVLPV